MQDISWSFAKLYHDKVSEVTAPLVPRCKCVTAFVGRGWVPSYIRQEEESWGSGYLVLCLLSSLPISSHDCVNRFYQPANSLSNHCFKSSSSCPDTYQVSRAAFYFCPRGRSFSAIATYSGKVICSGCFCPKELKTSCIEWLVHQPFYRTFNNSHFRCVGGRKSTHGPETLTKHPFYALYGLFCPVN